MEIANRLNGIGEYYFSQKMREIEAMNQVGEPVLNLGIGSPDLPPHSSVIEALQLQSAGANNHAYQSYKGVPALRKAMAQWYQKWYGANLDPESEILPLMGSKEGIMHVCMTFINPGDWVLIPNPGYATYRSAAMLAGGQILEYCLLEENNWLPNLDAIETMLIEKRGESNERTGKTLMFVNYPNMPTGALPNDVFFDRLVAFAKKHHLLICNDNPYSFILNPKPQSILSVAGAKEVAIELNSLSKSHNMAGWRIGMLSGGKKYVDAVLRFKSNMDSGMFLPLQLAAVTALGLNADWHRQLNEIYLKRKEKVHELLQLLHCTFSNRQAGLFVWAKISGDFKDGFALSDTVLQQSRVFVTPGGIFGSGGNKYIRISLCSPEEKILMAINRIKQSLLIKA